MQTVKRALATIFEPAHLRSTLMISFIVGSWLTAFNLGDLLLAGEFGITMSLKIFLNYLTPFVVANLGLLSRRQQSL